MNKTTIGKIECDDIVIPKPRQTSWLELLRHVGHKAVFVGYHLRIDPQYPLAVSVECETCGKVLVCHDCVEDPNAK